MAALVWLLLRAQFGITAELSYKLVSICISLVLHLVAVWPQGRSVHRADNSSKLTVP